MGFPPPSLGLPANNLVSHGEAYVSVEAVQHMKRMRGGAQAHLMQCSDGYLYVVKFRNNPQHLRVLTNEMFATRLAEEIGLPVPATAVVEVSDGLIENTLELTVQLAHSTVRCVPGKQFGSRYVLDPVQGQVLDYMPIEMLGKIRNLNAFAGALAFDKWTGNTDGRQAAYWRRTTERKYTAAFIDQGYCFNAGEWTFPDQPLRGVYTRNEVYTCITGWDSFDPWLKRIEQLTENKIRGIANTIPREWFSKDSAAFEELLSTLVERRTLVRSLIDQFRLSPRNPFPQWRGEA
jgi:hypothetical protein